MDWGKIAGAVGNVAPVLGALLAGPAGASAGALIASRLGVGKDPQSVIAALDSDMSAYTTIAKIESDERVRLAEIAQESVRVSTQADATALTAEVSDRASARQLAALQRDLVRPTLAFCLLGAAVIAIIAMFTFGRELMKDPTAAVSIGTVIGFLFNEVKQAMSFYFGGIRDVSRQQQANVAADLAATLKKGQN